MMPLAALRRRVPTSARLDRRTFLAIAVTSALAGCESYLGDATDTERRPRSGGVDGDGYGRAGFGEGGYGATDDE